MKIIQADIVAAVVDTTMMIDSKTTAIIKKLIQ